MNPDLLIFDDGLLKDDLDDDGERGRFWPMIGLLILMAERFLVTNTLIVGIRGSLTTAARRLLDGDESILSAYTQSNT